MRRLVRFQIGGILASVLVMSLAMSCGSSDYRTFSLREGIGHFSVEYPAGYAVTRIDVRDGSSGRYTDVGLGPAATQGAGLYEISVYAWPATGDESAGMILDDMLLRAAGIFQGFEFSERYSVMIGDLEGQAAVFRWTASASDNSTGDPLPAVSRIVCFREGDNSWEIHVAADEAAQEQGAAEFQHIIETFQILS